MFINLRSSADSRLKILLGENEADHVKLKLPEAPQRGQEGDAEGHGQRELDGSCRVAQVCGATPERAGEASAQDGASQRPSTQVIVQAATGVQGERVRSVEL